MLLRGSLPSEIALHGGSLESKIVYRGVGADFEKPKKIFSVRERSHITSSAEGGGGFQKMTLDDGGEGGFMVR